MPLLRNERIEETICLVNIIGHDLSDGSRVFSVVLGRSQYKEVPSARIDVRDLPAARRLAVAINDAI